MMSAFFPFELEPPPWLYRLLARGPLMQRMYRRLAADLAAALPPAALLVDVGAGPGHLAGLMAQARPDLRVVALDWSWTMLRPSPRPQLEENQGPRLRRLVGDSARIPLQSACCDLAVATFSFHTWDKPVLGMQEMRRIVKPGGQAWIYEMNREAVWGQWRALAREENLPALFVAGGFKLLSWNHALRAADFTATFAQAGGSGWQLQQVHHLFWRAVFSSKAD
jgi:ubiquinone/menaquinone biosynthesis C-methylase UbiE